MQPWGEQTTVSSTRAYQQAALQHLSLFGAFQMNIQLICFGPIFSEANSLIPPGNFWNSIEISNT